MRSKRVESAFPPLVDKISRTVRFEEIDAMGIMWHGRYPSWIEDGREALNLHYNISYLRFYDNGVAIPLRIMHFDYLRPLRYPQTYTIRTSLLWSEGARLDFAYAIHDAEGTLMTEAATTQLMVSKEGDLLLEPPAFFVEFRQRWQNGEL